MKFKSLLLILFVFIIKTTFAQTNFKKGYVVRSIADTLFGEIDYRNDNLMSDKCRFRVNKIETIYSPDDIIEYKFNDGKYFVSKQVGVQKLFLKFLIKGIINIYYLKDKKGDRFFLEKEGFDMVEIPQDEEFKYINNQLYVNNAPKYRGVLGYYMQDAPELKQSLDAITGTPDYNHLIRLAKEYHNAVCDTVACITFEEKIPFLKVELEILAGATNYSGLKNSFLQTGILGHIWMPRASENMFFRTGILFSTIQEEEKTKFFKIPLQVEYKYPKGIIRPVLAYGMNFYSYRYVTVGLMGGVNIKFNKSVYMGINYDLDFESNKHLLITPNKLFSQTVLAGIIIKI